MVRQCCKQVKDICIPCVLCLVLLLSYCIVSDTQSFNIHQILHGFVKWFIWCFVSFVIKHQELSFDVMIFTNKVYSNNTKYVPSKAPKALLYSSRYDKRCSSRLDSHRTCCTYHLDGFNSPTAAGTVYVSASLT